MHDGRAAAAPIAMKLNWTTTLSHSKGKHINLLELESLISLLSRVTREGVQSTAALGSCGFAHGFGSRLKKTIDLTKNQFLAPKIEDLVLCLRHCAGITLGAHLD